MGLHLALPLCALGPGGFLDIPVFRCVMGRPASLGTVHGATLGGR